MQFAAILGPASHVFGKDVVGVRHDRVNCLRRANRACRTVSDRAVRHPSAGQPAWDYFGIVPIHARALRWPARVVLVSILCPPVSDPLWELAPRLSALPSVGLSLAEGITIRSGEPGVTNCRGDGAGSADLRYLARSHSVWPT
jgi:hypothetical protein